jgi:hypothetical protein
MRHIGKLALASLFVLSGPSAERARADFVQIGSTFNVENTNFVDTFSQSVTFSGTGTNTSIDGGKLLINEQVFPTGPGGAWIVFNFATASGGLLAGNVNANWQAEIENVQFATSLVVDDHFCYFSVNGDPFSNLVGGDGFTVETNPVTGTGEVLEFGNTPGSPKTSEGFFVFADPYTVIEIHNLNPDTANGFTMAFHVDLPNPVPEPSALTLLAAGLGVLSTRSWRRVGRFLTDA